MPAYGPGPALRSAVGQLYMSGVVVNLQTPICMSPKGQSGSAYYDLDFGIAPWKTAYTSMLRETQPTSRRPQLGTGD